MHQSAWDKSQLWSQESLKGTNANWTKRTVSIYKMYCCRLRDQSGRSKPGPCATRLRRLCPDSVPISIICWKICRTLNCTRMDMLFWTPKKVSFIFCFFCFNKIIISLFLVILISFTFRFQFQKIYQLQSSRYTSLVWYNNND